MIRKYLAENIPNFFFKFETNQPFANCTFCDVLLKDKKHGIEKVLKNNKLVNSSEILFEYAICIDCMLKTQAKISNESMLSISAVMDEHKNYLFMKLNYLHETEKYDVASWIETCAFTGKPIHLCEEFTVSALVENNRLVFEQSPIAVSDSFMELIQENLSEETKQIFDDLKNEIILDSPSLEDILKTPIFGLL